MNKITKKNAVIKATIEVEVPLELLREFEEFVLTFGDFEQYLSWWTIKVVGRHKRRGLLVWNGGHGWTDDEEDIKAARKAWVAGGELPDGFATIQRTDCLAAYLEGIKLFGPEWEQHDKCDGCTYVEVFRKSGALPFGEKLPYEG